jgi:hypothetical protein
VIFIQLYKKKEARAMGKSFLANIPPPTCKKSGLEICLAQDAGPLGNLAARQADRQQKLASQPVRQRGKRYLSKGISRENLKAAGALGKEVVSRNYQHCFSFILDLT